MNDETGTADTDNDADLMAGFADVPTAAPAQEQTTEQPTAAEVVQEAVEYVQLTKAEHDELMSLRATSEKSFGTAFGKIGGIERTLQQIQSGANVDISQEDIDALKEDFAPLASALEKIRNRRAIPVGAGIDAAKIDELVQQRIAPALESIDTTVERVIETRLLAREHPDWQTVTQTPEFAAYTGTLPEAERNTLANSWDADFIGKHIKAFKAKRTQAAGSTEQRQEPTRKGRFDAAVTPRGSGAAPAADPQDEFEAGFKTG